MTEDVNENGIFRRAKIAKEQYEEAQAREKLETVLMEAVIEKETNGNYNNKEFLDNMLEEKGIAREHCPYLKTPVLLLRLSCHQLGDSNVLVITSIWKS